MATVDGSTSLDMVGDEFWEHACGSCSGGGRTKEAKHFCIDFRITFVMIVKITMATWW